MLEGNSGSVEAFIGKRTALTNLGRFQEGIDCFDRALQIDPEDAEVWDLRGTLLFQLARYEEALACFDKAIEIDPNLEPAKELKTEERMLGRMHGGG